MASCAARAAIVAACAILIVLAINVGVAEAKKKSVKTRRTGDLRKSRDADGVVTLTDGNFTAFGMEGPRPYAMMIYFTARDSQYHCFHCQAGEDEFRVLARSYQRNQETDPPIFFAVADFPENYGAFRAYEFKMAPVVAYRPPEPKRRAVSNPADFKNKEHQFGIFRPEHTATDLVNFLQDHMDIDVTIPIYRSPATMLWAGTIGAVAVALVAAVAAASPSWLLFFMKKPFWTFLCISVYFVAVSGMVSCIIRTPPWYTRSRDGSNKFNFFSRDSSSQYVSEGLIMGALNLTCALGVIVLMHFSKRGRSKFAYVLVAAIGIGLFAVGYVTIFQNYQAKNRWYSLQRVFPGEWRRWLRLNLGITIV